MFYQNWKLSLISIIMIPLTSIVAKSLGKRMGKVVTEAQEKSGFLNTYLIEIFKNHKLIKIFQKENHELPSLDQETKLKDKNKKIRLIYDYEKLHNGNLYRYNDSNPYLLFRKINF